MCVRNEMLAGCACAFGTGILLASFLPGGILVCIQGAVILGMGVFVLIK